MLRRPQIAANFLALVLVAHAMPQHPAFHLLTEIATPHVTAERAAAEKSETERRAAEREAEKAEKAAAEKAQPASGGGTGVNAPVQPLHLNTAPATTGIKTPATVYAPTSAPSLSPTLTIPASGTAVRRKDGRTPWYLNTPATVASPTTTQPTGAPAMTEIRTPVEPRPVLAVGSSELADPGACDARADAGECITSSTNSAAKSALMRKECQAACWKSWKDHAAEREAANKENAAAEQAVAEQAVAEQAVAEQAAAEKAAVTFQKAVAEKATAARAAEKAAADQAAAVEAEFQKAVAEKAAAEKAAAEKATAEKAAAEKAAAEKAAAVEAAFQRALAEQAAIEAAAAEKAAAAEEEAVMERAAAEKAAAGMAAAVEAEFQKAVAEKAAAEKAAAKEAASQKAAAVRKEAAEQAALARKVEAERAAAARKAALEKADAEMKAAAQQEYTERAAAEKAAFEIGIAQRAALTEFLVPADEPPNCAHRALQGECALECLSQWCARTQCKVTCERSDMATSVAAQNAAARQAYEENAAAEKATLAAILSPEPVDCPKWAAAGECEANPDFMLTECHMACELAIEAEKAASQEAAAEEAASEAEAAAEEAAAAAEAAAAKAYADAEAAQEKEAAEKEAAEKKEVKEAAAKEAAEEAAAEKARASFAQVLVIISDHESGTTEFGHALNTHPCVFDLGEPFSYTSMVWSTTEHVTGCNMSSFADAIFDSGTGTLRRRSNPVLTQKILALSSSKKPAMRPMNLTGDASSIYSDLKYDFADYFVRVRDLVCEGVPKSVCPPANCTITLNFFPQFVNANTAGQLTKERPPTKCMLARNEATMVAWEEALRSIAQNPKVAMMSLLRNEADRQFASFRQFGPAGTEFDCSLPRPPTSFATVSTTYTDGQLAIESCWAGATAADKCLGDALKPVGLRTEPMGGAGTTIMLAGSGIAPTSPTCRCDGDGPILTNPGDDELIVTGKPQLTRNATVLHKPDQKRLVRAAAARDVSAMTCRCEDDEPFNTQPEFAWNSTDLHNQPASGKVANLRMPRSASCSDPNVIFKRLANGELEKRAADGGAKSTMMPPVVAAPIAAAPASDALVERAVNESSHQPNREQQLLPPKAAAIDPKAAKKAEKEAAEAAKKAEKEAAEAAKKAEKEAAEAAEAKKKADKEAAEVAAAPVTAAPVAEQRAPDATSPVAEHRAPGAAAPVAEHRAPDATAPVAAAPAKRAQTREQEQQRTRIASKAAAAVKAAKAWKVVAEKAAVEAKAAAEAQAAKAMAAAEKAAAAKKDAAEKLAAVQVTEKAAAEKAVVENGNTEFEEPTWRSTVDLHITASIPETGPPWRQPASIPETGPPWRQPASIPETGPPWRRSASIPEAGASASR